MARRFATTGTLAVLGLAAGCARASAPWSLRLAVVPCAENRTEGGPPIIARDAVMVGENLVVAGEASGAFLAGAQRLRCPSRRAEVLVGLAEDEAVRFVTCIEGTRGFFALVPLPDGFAVAGHVARAAAPEAPLAASARERSDEAAGDEVAVHRFDREGRLVGRTLVLEDASRAGQVSAAATRDGSIVVAVSLPAHHEPAFVLGHDVEDRLFRVDGGGPLVALGTRTRAHAEGEAPVPRMLALRSGDMARVLNVDGGLEVARFGVDGATKWTVREPVEGGLIDLDAGAQGDDVVVVWSSRVGHDEPPAWRRRLAVVGATGAVARRPLGHEDMNAHTYGVIAHGDHGAAVLFQIWPNPGEPRTFEGVPLDSEGTAVVLGYDLESSRPPTVLATLGGGQVTALGFASSPTHALISGWFRGRLASCPPERFGCGAFAAVAPRR
jgi:hypothetical protein